MHLPPISFGRAFFFFSILLTGVKGIVPASSWFAISRYELDFSPLPAAVLLASLVLVHLWVINASKIQKKVSLQGASHMQRVWVLPVCTHNSSLVEKFIMKTVSSVSFSTILTNNVRFQISCKGRAQISSACN